MVSEVNKRRRRRRRVGSHIDGPQLTQTIPLPPHQVNGSHVKYVDGGLADRYVGLCFIEHVTNFGERSLVSWLKDLEESLRESTPTALKQREVY